nr:protein NRT1/ PTR FAMILY 5.5-like [Ipomoea batatas]
MTRSPDLAHTSSSTERCFDKAAIISPRKRVDEEEKKWKVCNVTEVEETKLTVQTAIVWPPIIICGLVSSIGNTFFVVQAAKMNHNIGKWQVPSTILLLLPKAAKYVTVAGYKRALKSKLESLEKKYSKELGSVIGPIYAMINTAMCCLFAALVETDRRHHIDHDETISVFWLIPQFNFLINVDATFHEFMKAFFKANAAPSMAKYAVHLTQFVWGIGEALSLVSVLACNKWFKNDVDQSRLDKYYWTLTALTALTFICYFVIVILKIKKQNAS